MTEEDPRIIEKREWLKSLTQADRDFIARYGEERWRIKKTMEEIT